MSRFVRWFSLRRGRNHMINQMRRFDRTNPNFKPWGSRYVETLWGISRHPDRKPLLHKGRKP